MYDACTIGVNQDCQYFGPLCSAFMLFYTCPSSLHDMMPAIAAVPTGPYIPLNPYEGTPF